MAINLSTFWGTWDVVSGNTSATNQYDFWKGMVMSTGQILNNQYEFFQYHNTTRYEWFRDLQSTYPEVYNEYTFYRNTNDPQIFDMRTFYEFGAPYLNSTPVTPTPTPTNTATPPITPSVTAQPTNTPSITAQPTSTPTNTPSVTAEPTPTPTNTPSVTAEPTATPTGTPVSTPTPTSSPTVDDAAAYLAAVVLNGGTVTSDITAAVNTLFADLKSAGIYSKLDILMPMVGGVKNSMLLNAKAPTGTSWGWTEYGPPLTYGSSGITCNGSSVLKSDFLVSSFVQCITGSSHFGIYYNRTTSGAYFSGFLNSQNTPYGFFNVASWNGSLYGGQYGGGPVFNASDTASAGWWYAQRTAINNAGWYRNDTAVQLSTDTVTYIENDPDRPICLFGLGWIGQGPNGIYTEGIDGSMCTVTIGGGLTSQEKTDLYDIITTFNISLNRVDSDAKAYLDAVVANGGTVDSTTTTAVYDLFGSLKATGLYSKLDILMPMVGGVKNSILLNAISPSGSWAWTEFGTPLTYNVSGITTNSNGALRSNFTFSAFTQSVLGNSHFSIYCNRPPVNNNSFNGMLITSPATTRFATGFYGNDPYFGQYQSGVGFGGLSPQVKGLWTSNTLLINTLQFYENATIRADIGDSNGTSIASQNMAIGTLYWPGQGYANNLYPSDLYTGTFATLTIGSGMSSTQMTDLNNIITTFNTTLSRA